MTGFAQYRIKEAQELGFISILSEYLAEEVIIEGVAPFYGLWWLSCFHTPYKARACYGPSIFMTNVINFVAVRRVSLLRKRPHRIGRITGRTSIFWKKSEKSFVKIKALYIPVPYRIRNTPIDSSKRS